MTVLVMHLELDFRFTLSVAQSWGDGTEAVATATVRLGDVAAVAVGRRRDHTAGTAHAAAASLLLLWWRWWRVWRYCGGPTLPCTRRRTSTRRAGSS